MRVRVMCRSQDGVIEGATPLKCERVDDKWYCEMPDDLEAFLKLVAQMGRFKVLLPNAEPQWTDGVWITEPVYRTLDFHNDYD
jgi:hypothetical protein